MCLLPARGREPDESADGAGTQGQRRRGRRIHRLAGQSVPSGPSVIASGSEIGDFSRIPAWKATLWRAVSSMEPESRSCRMRSRCGSSSIVQVVAAFVLSQFPMPDLPRDAN